MTQPVRMTGTPRLDDLISGVEHAHADPLDRVAGAAIVADALDETADHLVGHFVDRARRAGASWTDIGRSMGVTKQAVQKRFVPKEPAQDFARFTPRARNVVVAAQNETRAAGNAEIRPAHLVLGLLANRDGVAMQVLAARGVTPEGLRAAATAALPPAADGCPALIPFDAQAKKALELTFREALRLGHDFVGTEHVLLALLEVEGGSGVLSGLGVEKEAVEEVGGGGARSGRSTGLIHERGAQQQPVHRGGRLDRREVRAGDDLQPGAGMPAASVRACGSTGVAASSAPATTSVGAVIAASRSRWSQAASAAQQPM